MNSLVSQLFFIILQFLRIKNTQKTAFIIELNREKWSWTFFQLNAFVEEEERKRKSHGNNLEHTKFVASYTLLLFSFSLVLLLTFFIFIIPMINSIQRSLYFLFLFLFSLSLYRFTYFTRLKWVEVSSILLLLLWFWTSSCFSSSHLNWHAFFHMFIFWEGPMTINLLHLTFNSARIFFPFQ